MHLRIGNKSYPHSPTKRFIHTILSALIFVQMSTIPNPVWFFGLIITFLAILKVFLYHKKSNKVSSISIIILITGYGNTDSLYISCYSSSDFVIIIFSI